MPPPLQSNRGELNAAEKTYNELLEEFIMLSEHAENKLDYKELQRAHIQGLKKYNELRDTGLRLVQIIADQKACKVREVFEEMGHSMDDN